MMANNEGDKDGNTSYINDCFPESDNMILHQVLDPETKDFVDRQQATTLL